MGLLESLARDAVLARNGDVEATARLARRGLPWIAKSLFPQASPMVDIIAGGYDALVRPEAKPEEQRSSFDSRGAGRFKAWLRRLDHGLIVVVGATGTGKTTLLAKLADIWRSKSHRYIVGVSPEALAETPLEPFEWSPERIARLPHRSVLLVPDAGLYLDSRDWGGRRGADDIFRQLAQIARHREVVMALDVQYTRLLQNSAFLTRALIYRPLGVTWSVTERDGLIGLARKAQQAFNSEIPPDERIRYAYVFCDECDFEGFVSIDVPDWYSEAISRSHAGNVIDGEFREVDTD
jgi:energy-coupling factor transporter ATP-binding protein EcfA2